MCALLRNKRKSTLDKWKSHVSKAILASKTLQGDAWAGTQLALETASTWKKQLAAGMPPKIKPRLKKRPKNRRRRKNNFMGVSRIPCRRIIAYSATSGSKHRWYYQVRLSNFSKMFSEEYAEFKVTNIRVRYLPNNSTNETGLYTAVLLDREGFGAYGTATAVAWFATIGAMPGARVLPRYIASTYRWRPTEPSARDWRSKDQDTVYCTIYICNNGQETDELGGMLELSCTLLARGIYYNAAVKRMAMAEPTMFCNHPMYARDTIPIDTLHLASPSPVEDNTPLRSRASSICGFQTLG